MAHDIFLKLDGVTGEAQDDSHKDEIDILSYSWGVSQSGTTHMGSGGGSGKASFRNMSIVKYVDQSSTTLNQFCANGKHIASGKLTVRKAGENPLEYLTYELDEIIVTDVQSGGSASEHRHTEHVTLNFRSYKKTYTPQNDDGSGGAAVESAWDIAANKTK